MKYIFQLLHWFIPTQIRAERRLYTKSILMVSMKMISCLSFAFAFFFLIAHFPSFSFFLLALMAMIFANLIYFRSKGNYTSSANIYIGIIYICLSVVLYLSSGTNSIFLIWMITPIVYSFFLINRASGIFWLVFNFFIYVVFIYLDTNNILLNRIQEAGLMNAAYFINLILFTLNLASLLLINDVRIDYLLEEVEKEKNQTKLIVDNIPVGIGYCDLDLYIKFVNGTILKWYELEKLNEDALLIEFFGQEISTQLNLDINQLKIGQAIIAECFIPLPKNPDFFVRATLIPDRNENKELLGFFFLLEDFTSVKENELVKTEAKNAELKAVQLSAELERIKQKQLQQQIENKNRTLTSNAIFISKQNDFFAELDKSLKDIIPHTNPEVKQKINGILKKIEINHTHTENWENLKLHFENTHPDFFRELLNINASLNKNDLKHCAYIKLNLSNKEIANIFHISHKSVIMAHYRLKKKLGVPKDTSILHFINSL